MRARTFSSGHLVILTLRSPRSSTTALSADAGTRPYGARAAIGITLTPSGRR